MEFCWILVRRCCRGLMVSIWKDHCNLYVVISKLETANWRILCAGTEETNDRRIPRGAAGCRPVLSSTCQVLCWGMLLISKLRCTGFLVLLDAKVYWVRQWSPQVNVGSCTRLQSPPDGGWEYEVPTPKAFCRLCVYLPCLALGKVSCLQNAASPLEQRDSSRCR